MKVMHPGENAGMQSTRMCMPCLFSVRPGMNKKEKKIMRKNRLLKQSLAVLLSLSMGSGPCLPGVLTVYGESVQKEIETEEKATASNATPSDAMFDEDGFLLDGAVADDAESATSSDAELLLEGTLLNVSENALLSGTCGKDGDNLVWEITGTEGDYTLRISGEGEMKDYYPSGPWSSTEKEIQHLIIEEGVTSIGFYAFFQTKLGNADVRLPESLTDIGYYAFSHSGLHSITLPDHLKVLGDSAFDQCPIEELVLPGSLEYVGFGLLCASGGQSNPFFKRLTVQEGVSRLMGFQGCTSLKEVSLPDSLKAIGSFAFRNCKGLTTIEIPDGVESIGEFAFKDTSLEEIILPDSVKTIGGWCFGNGYMNKIKNVHLPANLEEIGEGAFEQAKYEHIDSNLPTKLRIIGRRAFYYFPWDTLEIPGTLEEIGDEAFYCCQIKDIYVDENNETFSVINRALVNEKTDSLVLYPRGSEETSYIVPDEIRKIGNYAFAETCNLEEVLFNDGLETVGEGAFSGSAIKEVILPDSVTSLGKAAFASCKNIEKIKLSAGLTTLPQNAFCLGNNAIRPHERKLKEIDIPEGITCLEGNVFEGCGIEIYHIPHSLTGTWGGYNFWTVFLPEIYASPKIVYYNGTEAEWNNISWAYLDNQIRDATIIFNGNIENPDISEIGWIEKDGHPWQYRRPDGTIINEGVYNLAYISHDDILYIGNFRFENGVVMSGWDENQEHYYCGENDEYPYGMELPPEPAERDVLKDYNSPQAGRFLDSYDFALTTFNDDLRNHPILVSVLSPDHIDKLLDNTLMQFIKQLFRGNVMSLKDLDMAYWYKKPETAKKVLAGIIDDMAKMEDSLNSETEAPDAYHVFKHVWGVDKSVMKLRTESKKDVEAIKNMFMDNEAFSAVSGTLDYASIKLKIDENILESVDTMINMSDDLKKGFSDYSRNLEILEALEEACGAPGNSGINVSSADQDELLLEAIRDLKQEYRTQYITETADYITDWIDLNNAWFAFLDSDAIDGIDLELRDTGAELFLDSFKPDPTPYSLLNAGISVMESIGMLDGRPSAMESVLKMVTLRNCLIYKLDQMHSACMLKSVQGEKITDEERKLFELLFEVNKRLTIKQYGAMGVFYQGGLGVFGREQDKINFLAGEIEKLEEMGPYTYAEAYDMDTHTGRYSASTFSYQSGWNGNHYTEGDAEYKNCWAWILGRKYYFDENGEAYTGLRMMDDGKMRYFSFRDEGLIHAGAMQTGIVYFGEDEYYFMPGNGNMAVDAYVSGRYYGKDGKRDPSQDTAFTYGVKANDPAVSKSEYMTMVRLQVRNADFLDPSGSIILKVRDGAITESADERIELRETDSGICLFFPPEIRFTVNIMVEEEAENIGISITEYRNGEILRSTSYNVKAQAGERYTASVSAPEPTALDEEEPDLRNLSLTGSDNDLDFVIEPEVKTEEEITYYRLEICAGEGGAVRGDDGEDGDHFSFVAAEGGTLPFTAVPDDGYRFGSWRCEDQTISSMERYIWIADRSSVIYADFLVDTPVISVTGIALDSEEVKLKEGEELLLTATVSPEDAGNMAVNWSSSDTSIAAVDSSGKVTAVKAGTATITVTTVDGGYTAVCNVMVQAAADPVEVFVKRLYSTCLGREADASGLNYWTGLVKNGTEKGIKLAGDFVFSKEFTNKNYCNEHFVRQLYLALMGRDPAADPSGVKYWTGVLDKGTTREALLNSFTSTSEYKKLCADAGIDLGNTISDTTYKCKQGVGTKPYGPCAVCGNETKVVQFAERMYTVCLGRTAETGGLAYWSKGLYEQTITGKSILENFFLSSEIQGKNLTNREYVRRIYKAMLDRDPDGSGWDYWEGRLNSGASPTAVIAGFIDSNEFTGICSDYGIKRK